MDEWWTTLMLMSHERRAKAGGVAAIMNSGGQRAHLCDLAEELRIPWAAINETTRARLRERLNPSLLVINPVDAWGGDRDWDEVLHDCFRAVVDDPDTAIGVAFTEFGASNSDNFPGTLASACKRVASTTVKPVVAATYTTRHFHPRVVRDL